MFDLVYDFFYSVELIVLHYYKLQVATVASMCEFAPKFVKAFPKKLPGDDLRAGGPGFEEAAIVKTAAAAAGVTVPAMCDALRVVAATMTWTVLFK